MNGFWVFDSGNGLEYDIKTYGKFRSLEDMWELIDKDKLWMDEGSIDRWIDEEYDAFEIAYEADHLWQFVDKYEQTVLRPSNRVSPRKGEDYNYSGIRFKWVWESQNDGYWTFDDVIDGHIGEFRSLDDMWEFMDSNVDFEVDTDFKDWLHDNYTASEVIHQLQNWGEIDIFDTYDDEYVMCVWEPGSQFHLTKGKDYNYNGFLFKWVDDPEGDTRPDEGYFTVEGVGYRNYPDRFTDPQDVMRFMRDTGEWDSMFSDWIDAAESAIDMIDTMKANGAKNEDFTELRKYAKEAVGGDIKLLAPDEVWQCMDERFMRGYYDLFDEELLSGMEYMRKSPDADAIRYCDGGPVIYWSGFKEKKNARKKAKGGRR